jgi:broad specificity phosphatase PhoE
MKRTIATLCVSLVLLAPLTATAAEHLVIIVRHAEKESDSMDPGLTPQGRKRAAALAQALADTGIDCVISTPVKRTTETAAPVVEASGASLELIDVLAGLDAHVAAVADTIRARPAGEAILVVGHSNTIGYIVTALGGPEIGDLSEAEYDTMYILTLSDAEKPRLVIARYGAPDGHDGP